jgi:hypothetical protein
MQIRQLLPYSKILVEFSEEKKLLINCLSEFSFSPAWTLWDMTKKGVGSQW